MTRPLLPRVSALAGLALVALVISGCGSRISLGEMGGDEPSDAGGLGADAQGPPDAPVAPVVDAGKEASLPDQDGGFPVEDGGAAWVPCAAKACGDTCKICPPWDTGCAETAVIKQCDKQGQCTPGVPSC